MTRFEAFCLFVFAVGALALAIRWLWSRMTAPGYQDTLGFHRGEPPGPLCNHCGVYVSEADYCQGFTRSCTFWHQAGRY